MSASAFVIQYRIAGNLFITTVDCAQATQNRQPLSFRRRLVRSVQSRVQRRPLAAQEQAAHPTCVKGHPPAAGGVRSGSNALPRVWYTRRTARRVQNVQRILHYAASTICYPPAP